MMQLHQKTDCYNNSNQASYCTCATFTPCENEPDTAPAINRPSHCSNDQPSNCDLSNPPHDASPPHVCNPCGFFKDTCVIESVECKMHNPATGTRRPKTMVPCKKPLTLSNLAHFLPHQVVIPICRHVTIVILTPLFMLTTLDDAYTCAGAPLADCAVILEVMNAMMMIIAKFTLRLTTTGS